MSRESSMSASSEPIEEDEKSEIKPHQTMRGHTDWVHGVAHLPDGQHIIAGSYDGTLRKWERESGAQIGNAWEDEEDDEENNKSISSMALSPNGKTLATGHAGGTVKLWDMEMKKVTTRWTEHTAGVWAVCWSGDGRRVVSGSEDGTARVWDMHVNSGETVLGPIETGDRSTIHAVAFSPDASILAIGGETYEIGIWDARTGELLSTLEQDSFVWSLVWTSDQKKLLAGNDDGSIAIFDTATWQQIALLEDQHNDHVSTLSLFHNDRLLASGSGDGTARLRNLDANLPVGPPLQHQDMIRDTAFSADGRFLATACDDHNAYVWDVHAILQEAGLEDLLSTSNVTAGKSILGSDAMRHPKKPKEYLTIAPRGFFDSSTPPIDPPPSTVHLDPPPATPPADLPPPNHSNAPPSARVRRHLLAPFTLAGARALLGRISSRFSHSQPRTVQLTELQQFLSPGNVSVHAPADSGVQDNQFDATLPLATLQHPTDEIIEQRCDTPGIHFPNPHPLVNHTPTKSVADTGGRMTNFNWRRPSPNIKGKQKQRRSDGSALKVVDVPLGEATYGDYVANREDVVRPYSLFFCLRWCRKKDQKQNLPRQQYDIELLYSEEENATPNDPVSTNEVRPTAQQGEFELSVMASQPQSEAGPSRLPGNAEHIFDVL